MPNTLTTGSKIGKLIVNIASVILAIIKKLFICINRFWIFLITIVVGLIWYKSLQKTEIERKRERERERERALGLP